MLLPFWLGDLEQDWPGLQQEGFTLEAGMMLVAIWSCIRPLQIVGMTCLGVQSSL